MLTLLCCAEGVFLAVVTSLNGTFSLQTRVLYFWEIFPNYFLEDFLPSIPWVLFFWERLIIYTLDFLDLSSNFIFFSPLPFVFLIALFLNLSSSSSANPFIEFCPFLPSYS